MLRNISHHWKLQNQPRYLEALGTVLATHLLTLERRRKSTNATGLTPVQMRRVQEHIDAHLGETITVATLAAMAGLGHDHFTHLFKVSTGLTPHRFVMAKRIQHAQVLLKKGKNSIAEIAAEAGFFDQSHLGRCLRKFCERAAGSVQIGQKESPGILPHNPISSKSRPAK